jgi:hypothetical protein
VGLLSNALDALTKVAKPSGEAREIPPIPDLGTLVTTAEIESVTGAMPVGEPRRNGPQGSEVIDGRLVIWEAKLSNGDKFLITLSASFDEAGAKLTMDRMNEAEHKPLEGVGDRGLVRVKSYKKSGKSEVGVSARKGVYTLSLTWSSSKGETDYGPLTDLLRTALTRF